MKRFLLLIAGLAVILVGVVSFAAFESHIVKIKAHVESATYTSPGEINFDTVFPEESVTWCQKSDLEATSDAECTGEGCPHPGDKCLKIKLSHSFLQQRRVKDVDYTVYCEGPQMTCREGDAECEEFIKSRPQPITPYIVLESEDEPGDEVLTINCVPEWVDVDMGKPGQWKPVEWAMGNLNKWTGDIEDQWDLTLWVPACRENYNGDTDPYSIDPDMVWPEGIPHFVDKCNKGAEGDSYRWVDLSGAIKFQVTGYSYCKPCRAGESDCECE